MLFQGREPVWWLCFLGGILFIVPPGIAALFAQAGIEIRHNPLFVYGLLIMTIGVFLGCIGAYGRDLYRTMSQADWDYIQEQRKMIREEISNGERVIEVRKESGGGALMFGIIVFVVLIGGGLLLAQKQQNATDRAIAQANVAQAQAQASAVEAQVDAQVWTEAIRAFSGTVDRLVSNVTVLVAVIIGVVITVLLAKIFGHRVERE